MEGSGSRAHNLDAGGQLMKRIVIGILAAMLAAGAQKADEAERLLKAAMNTELVDGNLQAAIEQYEKVVQSGNRAAAAQALIHMAECYQKLGGAESRKIYERVLREYADQKEAAAIARARLGRNGAPRETGVVVRQVWAGDDVNPGGRPSPDGRYFVFADWKSEDLVVRDLKSGENRFLTQQAQSGGRDVGARFPIFSPDGKQVAYQWHDKGLSLRVIGFDGSRMRVLMSTVSTPFLPVSFSPDGKQIVCVLAEGDGTSKIALISAVDGSATQLKSTGWRRPRVGGFSPDGRYLVYSLPKSNASASDGGIFVIAADGSRETAIIPETANEQGPVWTPDGRAVVFKSDRSGTTGLWSIRIADGKPQGSPELVRANIGSITPFGFSRDGSFLYGTSNRQTNVYAADIDPETLRAVSQPSLLTEKFVGSNWGPAWSPDGRSIAFFRATDDSPSRSIVIRSVATGEERTLPVRIEQRGYITGYFSPHWFPDSRSLLVWDTANSRWVFQKINTETGEGQVAFETSSATSPQARLSPDGKALYYSIRGERVPQSGFSMLHLRKRNLETGQDVELYRAESPGASFYGLAVSPDGACLSFSRNDVEQGKRTLLTLPTEGGARRELHRGTYDQATPFAGAWTSDGRYVLFTVNRDDNAQQLWAIPAEGGEPRPLDITMRRLLFPAVSRDGRRIAFTGTRDKNELWVIHNLLPEMRASR